MLVRVLCAVEGLGEGLHHLFNSLFRNFEVMGWGEEIVSWFG